MVTKPRNVYKCVRVPYIVLYYIHNIPPTCFGQTCGHPQGGAVKRMYYESFLNLCINVSY